MLRHTIRVHRRSHGPNDGGGFTILELVVAIAILGVIIVPLTMAFITMVRNTGEVDKQLSRTADAQRIGAAWTKDVQSVDPGGVNSAGSCQSSAATTTFEVQLVTFSWNGSSTAGGIAKSATWVAVGNGDSVTLVRRYCENESPVSTVILADGLGPVLSTIDSVVHGPVVGSPRNFCPVDGQGNSKSCTIKIEGGFDYSLTVSRRTADMGASTVVLVPPPPPTITGAAGRNGFITVSWTHSVVAVGQPPVTTYRAQASTTAYGDPIKTVEVDGSTTVADLTSITNGTGLYIRMQAANSVGWGELSPPWGPVTPNPTGPEKPTVTGITAGNTTLTVTWTANVNNGGATVTSWTLKATPQSGGIPASNPSPVTASITPGTATTGSVPGLQNGVQYIVTVTGVNSVGAGVESDPSAPEIPYGVPGKATITGVVQNSNGTLTVNWTAPSFNGGRPILGYRVVASGGTGGPYPSSSTYTSAGTLTMNATGLQMGNSYTFVVLTNNLAGNSTSDPSAAALARTVPGSPAVSSSVTGSGSIRVTWTAPGSNGGAAITGYKVTWTPSGGTPAQPISTNASTFLADIDFLSSGQSYTFSVVATNAAGDSTAGTTTITALGNPGAPSSISIARTPGNTYPFSARVSYGRPSNPGGACINRYEVQFSNDGSTVVGTANVDTSPGAYPGCASEPGTTYDWGSITAGVSTRYFRVRARNTGSLFGNYTSWTSTTVLRQQCRLVASEDSWTNDSNPWFGPNSRDDNYGGDGNLEVDSAGARIFVKFDPRSNGSACESTYGYTGQIPAAAVLTGTSRVYLLTSNPSTYCRDVGIFKVTGNWSEYGITYDNQPGTGGENARVCSNGGGYKSWVVPNADANEQRTDATRRGWNMRDVGGNILSSWSHWGSRETGNKPLLDLEFY